MGLLHFDFMSEKLGYQTNVYVVLPDCVQKGKAPGGILYLLHGGGGNGQDWLRFSSVERYSWPYELAIIMPEVDGSCFYADMKYGYPYFQYLTEELPAAMEAMLPLLKNVGRKYVAGFSMGGYGAYKWAFLKPDYFTAAANLSGVSFIMDILGDEAHALPGKQKMIESNWGSLAELAGSESDSKVWIDRAASEKTDLPALFAAIGTEDVTYPQCKSYLDYCAEKGVKIHYEEMPGGHDWDVWDEMIRRFLAWAQTLEER